MSPRGRLGALLLALCAGAAAAEAIDGCSTLLGSIGVELRYARQLPRETRTTFACPRDTHALLGASRERVLAALGPPDQAGAGAEGGGMDWDYWFGPRPPAGEERPRGQPGLRFAFDPAFQVRAIECLRHP